MRCNWRRWLWGIVPLMILTWVAVHAERWRIEADLSERAKHALESSGLGWAAAAFEGRDAVMAGKAVDEAEPRKASEVLSNVWGVRQVDNRSDLLDKVENYVWSASRRNNRIRLTGFVPNAATRQAILGVTKANFPGYEVVDRTRLARGVPSSDAWLTGVSFALKQLASLKRGDVRLDGLGLVISGEAEDVTGYRAVKAALNEVPKGMKLVADRVVAPAVSPFTFAAQWTGGQLVLSGYVPNEAARTEIMAAARAISSGAIDHTEPAEGAPQGWQGAVVAAMRVLARLESGNVEMKDAVMVLGGFAADDAAAEAARAGVRGSLPASIRFTDQIQVRGAQRKAEEQRAAADPAAPTELKTEAEPKAEAPAIPKSSAPSAESPTPPKAEIPLPAPEQPTVAKRLPALPSSPSEPAPKAVAPSEGQSAAAPPKPDAPPPSSSSQATLPQTEREPSNIDAPAKGEPQRQAALSPPASLDPAAKACQEQLTELLAAGRILFRLGSADLDQTSAETLNKVADATKACPEARVEIAGHASAEGSTYRNRRLSLRRAQAVLAYLVRAGVDADRLEPTGYGSARPIAPNDNRTNMAKNRRIEFVVRSQ